MGTVFGGFWDQFSSSFLNRKLIESWSRSILFEKVNPSEHLICARRVENRLNTLIEIWKTWSEVKKKIKTVDQKVWFKANAAAADTFEMPNNQTTVA